MNASVIVGMLLIVLVLSLLFRWRQKIQGKEHRMNPVEVAPQTSLSSGSTQREKIPGTPEDGNGLEKIRREDPSFDENLFKGHASAFFLQLLALQEKRNISELRQQMTDEMFASFKAEEDKRTAEGKLHKIENIALQSVELTDAWQENGQDFIKVKYLSSFNDCHVEEGSGNPGCDAAGEKIAYTKEWIFSRISGRNPWCLSAIDPA